MIISITYIELKSPLLFFSLSASGMKVVKQLKSTPCLAQKNTGFWKKHYTMTAWENAEDMKAFAHSGAHKEAMKKTGRLARVLRFATIEADRLPGWKEAKAIVAEGKAMRVG